MPLHHISRPSFPKPNFAKQAHARAVQAHQNFARKNAQIAHDRFRKNAQAARDGFLRTTREANKRFEQDMVNRRMHRSMVPASGSGAVMGLLIIIVAAYFVLRIPSSEVRAWLVRHDAPPSVSDGINSALYDAKKAEATMWPEIAGLQKAAASDPQLQAELKQLKRQLKPAENAVANTR
jgi:hypothetical protein